MVTKKINDVKESLKDVANKDYKGKVVDGINGIGAAIGSKPPSEGDTAGVMKHGTDAVKEAQKKAHGVLKTADAIASSPEVSIVGGLLGGETEGAIKKT